MILFLGLIITGRPLQPAGQSSQESSGEREAETRSGEEETAEGGGEEESHWEGRATRTTQKGIWRGEKEERRRDQVKFDFQSHYNLIT